jgi:hypothetical protein
MKRLTFANTLTGAQYTVPINPIENNRNRLGSVNTNESLDGPSTYQYKPSNFVEQKFVWKSLPNTSEFADMISQLKTYRGSYLWVLDGTAGTELNNFWQPIRCIDVKVVYGEGKQRNFACATLEFVYILTSGASV